MSQDQHEPEECNRTRHWIELRTGPEAAGPVDGPDAQTLGHIQKCRVCSELISEWRAKALLRRAVSSQAVPPNLRHDVHLVIRGRRRGKYVWAIAAAAALAIALGGWAAFQVFRGRAVPNSIQASNPQRRKVLTIGLGDHVHCAIDSGFAGRVFTEEQMAEDLGLDYRELVSVLRKSVPGDLKVVVGHRCRYDGRQFIHLVLRNGDTVLSLVITRKNGEENLDDDAAAIHREAGLDLYQARLKDFEVTGFQTRDYLAFVVSNLDSTANLLVASNIAPGVKDILTKREGANSPQS